MQTAEDWALDGGCKIGWEHFNEEDVKTFTQPERRYVVRTGGLKIEGKEDGAKDEEV